MKNINGITVTYITSNEIYDIYAVGGIDNVEENEDIHYHEELRNSGSDEEYVLNLYIS